MDTIVEKANQFFKNYINIQAAQKMMPKNEKTVFFNIQDDDSFIVFFKNNKIDVLKKEVDKKNMGKLFNIVIDTDKQTIYDIFNLKLTPAEAYHNRRLYFNGIPYKEFPWITHFIRILQTERDEC